MSQEEIDFDWNEDIAEDVSDTSLDSLVVYSRDWTVETILNQISYGNVDLNPSFQRRNAWNDNRRSLLIESLVIGMPVPEIVLAEDKQRKRSFIVLDGKQRLLTLAGFANPEIDYWGKSYLRGLKLREDLNSCTFTDLKEKSPDDYRAFLNADIRCTIISNYASTDILYNIFYRLNTGSVPLSTQELRHVLNKGPFADYLIKTTNDPQPVHDLLKLDGPDPRLRDCELLLRYFSFSLFAEMYRGNLKQFLDTTMATVNEGWDHYSKKIEDLSYIPHIIACGLAILIKRNVTICNK